MDARSRYFTEWRIYIYDRRFLKEFILSILLLSGVLFSLTKFLLFIQSRSGVILPDPLVASITAVDLTWPIFSIIYASLLISIVTLLRSPLKLLEGIQLYSLMVLIRMLCMYLVPLEPPAGHILLSDPFVENFGTGSSLTKDLFFSGHTATLFILFLISDKGLYKKFLLAAIILVASFVIVQHVHYSIDVIAALFITYCCFLFVRFLHQHGYLIKELDSLPLSGKIQEVQYK